MANIGQQNSNLPSASLFDNATFTNYTRTFAYDNGGNLVQIRHSAPASGNNYTTTITISDKSNCGVLNSSTEIPEEVDNFFYAGGLQRELQAGQTLFWTPRNELQKVTLLQRRDSVDDSESYRYDANRQRVSKVTVCQADSAVRIHRAIYLQDLEVRTTTIEGAETEHLNVITMAVADQCDVCTGKMENRRGSATIWCVIATTT